MKYRFKGQHQDEEIKMLLRPHWIFFIKHALIIFALLLLLLAFLLFGPQFLPIFTGAYLNLTYWIITLYVLFIWLYFFLAWLDFYLDSWIITDKRVIDIKQRGLFKRELFECPLVRVQTITVKARGLFSTFANYGNVYLKTTETEDKFILKQIPQPYKVKDLISQLITKK